MSNYLQIMAETRSLLGRPLAQSPSRRELLLAVEHEGRALANALANTGRAWSVGEYTLETVPAQSEYQIGDATFGKPLSVTFVPSALFPDEVRDVEFYELQNLDFDFNGSASSSIYGDQATPFSPLRIAFYRKGSLAYCRVLPTPQTSARYRVLFQTGASEGTNLMATTPAPEHDNLLVVRSALAALPLARWSGDAAADRARREELFVSLRAREARYDESFRRWALSLRDEGMSFRQGVVFD